MEDSKSSRLLSPQSQSSIGDVGVTVSLQSSHERISDIDNRDIKYLRLKLLGVTDEEMKRWSALKRMGLTNEDFEIGSQIIAEGNIGADGTKETMKAEKLMGYTANQIKRAKALQMLGTTEEEIDEVKCRRLCALGVGAPPKPPMSKARSSL